MSITFPSSPTVGQIAAVNGRTYIYAGNNAWKLSDNVTSHAASHGAGGGDPVTLTSSQISDFSTAVAAVAPASLHPFLLMGG